MTEREGQVYMLLLLAGLNDEALAFRDRCNAERDQKVARDGLMAERGSIWGTIEDTEN